MSQNDPRQSRFIAEYASGLTISEAAKAAEISKSTATRWLRDPAVTDEVASTRNDIRRRVVDLLAGAATAAVGVLVEIALDPERSDTARVSAARAILSEARTFVEVEELRQRVDAIEQGVSGAADLRLMVRSVLAEGGAA